MPYKLKPFVSIIPKPNTNQLALELTEPIKPKHIILPPVTDYDDPDFIRMAIEKVKAENKARHRVKYRLAR